MQNWPLPFMAILAVLTLLFAAPAAAGPSGAEITSVDTMQYPQVTLDRRGLGAEAARELGGRRRAVPLKLHQQRVPGRLGDDPDDVRIGQDEVPVRIALDHDS